MAAAFAVVAMVMAVAVIAPTTSEVEEADGIVIEASLLAIGLVASVIYGAGVGTGWSGRSPTLWHQPAIRRRSTSNCAASTRRHLSPI